MTLSTPVVPLVANVLAGPGLRSAGNPPPARRAGDVHGALARIDRLACQAPASTLFVELGAGKVLSGLAKRIAEGAETLTVGAPDDIDAATARLA